MARITLADHEDIDLEYRGFFATPSAKEGLPAEYHHLIGQSERSIYHAIDLIPLLLEPFQTFGKAIWDHCGLKDRQWELAILTVARTFDADYGWH